MRIHIVCPSEQVNGSAESLHQFGRAAATAGYDVRIAYLPDGDVLGPVPSAFRSYGLRPDQDIADEPGTVVLVPHQAVDRVAQLTTVTKLVWWLRVDEDAPELERALAVPGAVHLAQSEYARRFLGARGVDAQVVGDYIRASFIKRAEALAPEQRLDAVLYRADPTDAVTPRLIEASGDVLSWVPVTGLAADDVAELMAYSKLYVDFGSHQGRTRLVREALAAGCCVVTGNRGAAATSVDLPEGFRFDDAAPVDVVPAVLDRIALTLMEFSPSEALFEPARVAVRGEEAAFRDRVPAVLAAVLGFAGGDDQPPSRAGTATTAPRVPRLPAPAATGGPARPGRAVVADNAISVVIATIPPRAKLLRRAMDSVVAQTLPPAALVVEWDHGRTGAAATKNRAVEKVTTEWVAMLDDDDAFLPEHLEKLHRCALQSDADVVYSIPRADAKGARVPPLRFGQPFDAAELRRAPYIPNTVLARTDLVRKVGGFEFAPGTVWDDYGLFLKLLEVGASFVHLPEVTWIWNQVGQGTAGLPTW